MVAHDKTVLVYVTAPDRAVAESLGREMVGGRLAACANVLGDMQSFYWWQGTVQNETEVAVLFKTRKKAVRALTDAITKAHPHDCPCVVALDISGGNSGFLDWIVEETTPGKD